MATILKNNKKLNSKIFKFVKVKKNQIEKFKKIISNLKVVQSTFYPGLHFLLTKNHFKKQKLNLLVSYVICFNFSQSNSIIQVSNANGHSKFFCSAGLVDLTGKQKIARRLVLLRFLRILSLLKLKLIKNQPVALHLKNVGFNKYFITKKLKNKFFIKLVKTFNLSPYNGCRKKKEKRKR